MVDIRGREREIDFVKKHNAIMRRERKEPNKKEESVGEAGRKEKSPGCWIRDFGL